MSIWSTLGIDPTRDKREIKRAYAKMAARYHPEEQPEKFQEIYDAYEQALSYAEGYAGTEYHFEEVVYKEEPNQDPEISLGNHASVPKSEMLDFYRLTAGNPDNPEKLMPPNEENSINFDGKIPKTPRQRIVLKNSTEENQIDFEGKIPKTPRQGLNRIENDEEVRIDFEQLALESDRKPVLKPQAEQTINFQSVVKEEPHDKPQYHVEPEVHVKKKMSLKEALKYPVMIGVWYFIWGLLHIFTGGDVDFFSGFKESQSGQQRVQRTLKHRYDTDFLVTPIEVPDSMNGVYYLVADGKEKEDYQWFECSTTDEAGQVTFIASYDSGLINYDYSYKQLFAFLNYVGLGGYVDYADIQKSNLSYMNKGEKRYCYPIIKLSSGNLNEDFFQRINQLCDLIQNSEAQFYNSEQLTINIKNSSNGAVYNLHIRKGKKVDIVAIKQELLAFFER